ncbi:sulfotransferase family protein [Formosa maritima]|uniref:Sulfotransferase n=1 Tax=Formosa maritima TaxID=2592046 RepID=A0A5D0G4P8_9FLAO|nr:sulfotransferase [Formosa maritima]TYA53825.1 sulfotransferase [Formosa maritima]
MKAGTTYSSSDYNKQPGWFNLLNSVWLKTYALGTKSTLEIESLKKAAIKATGLSDFGNFWEEPLKVMLKSINEEAKLHPIGQFIARQRIINLLAVRLRAEDYFKKYPEILEQELYPCMVIVGLQRTGTTKLQRLLAADPDNRALLSWEALNPAPLKGDDKTGKERLKIAQTSVKALKHMSPGFFAIHPLESEAPEEDVLLLDVSFLSTTTEATMNVPTYAAWLEKTDQSPAYEYMVKLLKLLQWQRPAKRWVLKTPHHLEFLPMVKKHFGDVQFIWTHRNVQECIPSFLSMVSYSRILFSKEVKQIEVAKHWVRKNGYMLQKALDYRTKIEADIIFTDISYNALVKDSLVAIKKIYADRDEIISPELKNILEKSNNENPKGKYGIHKYNLEDFGIDETYISEFTKEYQTFQQTLEQ